MTAHRDPCDERLDAPGLDTRAAMRPAKYSSMRMWLVGSLAAIGFIAAIYGYGEYKATTAIKTSSQVETTGAASTPSPPPSTTGQGGVR